MRGTIKISTVAVSALALALSAGCGTAPNAPSAGGDTKPADVLALLASDVTGSVHKVAEVTKNTRSMRLTMEARFDGVATKAEGVIAYGDPMKAELTMDMPDGKMTVRLIGAVEYIQIPATDRGGLDGKKWMKLDLTELAKQAGGGDAIRQFQDMDPGKQVRLLLAGGTLKAVGEEQVEGARTMHYTGTAPIDTYLKQLDVKVQPEVKKQLGAMGAAEMTVDLWVDENYQPRRVRSVAGRTESTVTYSDFGTPVSVTAPPAAETADFSDMLKGLKLPTGK
ncbi:LppX_LprAFG lipoprotein [Rhizomonospora bruguierae]|uniref:LppX_LprAFG lipoprotein n=1 Tax=Rhizomonospora bruguierae TaxID=1581705 RepID=UPI001BCEFDF5|nr:LppX_LprAFG lipoprotein [Micromonospora sp. NBRC 107566]